MESENRLNSEWVTVNAVRELLKMATKGDMRMSTYDAAMEFGGEIYPELLGLEVSLLRRRRENETVKEYKQKSRLKTIKSNTQITPLSLIREDINELEDLLQIAKQEKKKEKVDQLKRRLALLKSAEKYLSPESHTENQIIFRDAYNVEREMPELGTGKAYKSYKLPDGKALRIRVLHPDIPEQVTGADIIYERHSPEKEEASIVAIQYKIWEKKSLLLSDPRLKEQLKKLEKFTCKNKLCSSIKGKNDYRFPYCAAFLRPTDKLQNADQALISSGEHLPICQVQSCTTKSSRGKDAITYDSIKNVSLSHYNFEYLFNSGKIGSRMLSYVEIVKIYEKFSISKSKNSVVIHAQEV